MGFERFSLHPDIMKGIKSAGFVRPTPVQEQVIPSSMARRDVLGLAQTGTGKTAAFILPILHRLKCSPQKRGIRVLIIAPTRELAEQIHEMLSSLGKYLNIKSVTIFGGVSKGSQLSRIRSGAQVVIACPGRLLDHVSERNMDLSQLEVLILDEADTMCDMGFLPEVRRILKCLPSQRQTLLFSATMPDAIRPLAMAILKQPVLVQIQENTPSKLVSHRLYPVPEHRKMHLLMALLERKATGRVVVFTRTKYRAKNLATDLRNRGYKVAALQGNMSQAARQRSMQGFRNSKFDILVATDIAAHGIDVPEVSHVINFDLPDTSDAYTHRIGRTGRADQSGEAFTLAGPSDGAMVYHIEKRLKIDIERCRLSDFDYGEFVPEKQFLGVRTAYDGYGQSRKGRHNTSSRGAHLRERQDILRKPKKRVGGSPNENDRRTDHERSPKPSVSRRGVRKKRMTSRKYGVR